MMRLAELDPIQIAIIIIAMLVGFIQWLWKVIQQSIEEKQRNSAPQLSPEERKRREAAWRRQAQSPHEEQDLPFPKPAAPAPVRPSPTATPPPINDPWSAARETFEKWQKEIHKSLEDQQQSSHRSQAPDSREAQEAHRRPTPPTLPEKAHIPNQPRPQSVAEARAKELSAKKTARNTPAPHLPNRPIKPAAVQPASTSTRDADLQSLRRVLMTPESLRQAVLLKEILGPPKSLQISADCSM